jgi:hypothetical protein
MSSTENSDQSIFQAFLDLFNGEPPKPEPVKKLSPIPTPGQMIYEKTMTSEFKAHEATIDAKAKEKWGVNPKHWLVTRYDNPRDKPKRSYAVVYDWVIQAAKRNDLDPHFLHTVAMGEGLMQYLDAKQNLEAGAEDRSSHRIDTFQILGLDNIGETYMTLNGYLDDKYFQYIEPKTKRQPNEKHKMVLAAYISGIDAGIFALSATLQKCHLAAKSVIASVNEQGKSATLDQEYFITYALFNNPVYALPDIKRLGVNVYTRKYDIKMSENALKAKEGDDQTNIRFNCLIRMSSYQRMKDLGVYE